MFNVKHTIYGQCAGIPANSILQSSIAKGFVMMVLLFFCFYKGHSQDNVNYAIHANIIYHFTKYIDWPQGKKSGDFLIGLVGDSPLLNELKASVANRKVGQQTIVVKQISASASVLNYHILFISDEEKSSLKKIAAATKGSAVLLVSESENLIKKGSCINFIIVNDRVRLEINKEVIEERNLNIASELLQLGTIVKQ